MLDLKLIRENPQLVKEGIKNKNESELFFQKIVDIERIFENGTTGSRYYQ